MTRQALTLVASAVAFGFSTWGQAVPPVHGATDRRTNVPAHAADRSGCAQRGLDTACGATGLDVIAAEVAVMVPGGLLKGTFTTTP